MTTKGDSMQQNQIGKKTALVIDDELPISRACQRVLETEGFEVDIALNCLIAMKMVHERKYDFCLSDIRTPGMNGVEFYRYLEKACPDLTSKMVFTTGDVLSGNTSEFLKEVKRPCLSKPFTLAELIKIIRLSCKEAASGSQV
jgi:DNA-binding NtrC family response regulator